MMRRTFRLLTIGTAVLSAATCSKSEPTSSPLSPSSLSPSPIVAAPSGATVTGIVNGGGGTTVSVTGTSLQTTTDSAGHFELTDVPVGDIELRFRNAGADAVLAIAGVAEADRIELAITVSGVHATVTTHRRKSDQRIELKGLVSGVGGGCPDVTFTLNGIAVTANVSTRFEDGPCSAVQNGTRVEVKGTREPDGRVLAKHVDIDEPEPPRTDAKLDGVVAELGGSCPDRTFVVTGTAVVVNAATRYEDGTCATLRNGTRVQVKGLRQPNGAVIARDVDIDEPDTRIKLDGLVSGRSGVCPNLTFNVAGTPVVTNVATRYEDGTCNSLQDGTRVQVKGQGSRQSAGSVLANEIDIDDARRR